MAEESSFRDRRQVEDDARVISRHLPSGYSAEPGAASGEDRPRIENPEQDSLTLQGGDVHREIFKIGARAKLHQRAHTFGQPSLHRSDTFDPDITAHDQQAPGGFRRQFFERQQKQMQKVTRPITKNFVSFLELYGSFAGENLAASDEDSQNDGDMEDAEADESDAEIAEAEGPAALTRPLLGHRKSTYRSIKAGDASLTTTFFTLLKAFIGTGIMFLPKAFRNGGIIFSSATLVIVSLISCLCFRLLLECRTKLGGGGYGDLGAVIGGPKLRKLILSSITISQIGFVCTGVIFFAENMATFLNAVTPSHKAPLNSTALIAIQLIVLVPLALIRNISRLGMAALLADIFIFIGLIYIWYFDISTLATQGIHPTVTFFNPSTFTLTIGSSIFTFEGIGLILPIQSSMAEPQKFSRLLYTVMVIITIIFASIGALCYATFGDQTSVEIISNFPQDSKLVNAVQFLYSLAVLVGTPVQLFPATRILETSLFGDRRSGKRSLALKWKKNALRAAITLLCAVISVVGASDLDKFVALIGSFACVPLVYIYPALLHYKGVAEGTWSKIVDIVIILVGLAAMVYTTLITLSSWIGR